MRTALAARGRLSKPRLGLDELAPKPSPGRFVAEAAVERLQVHRPNLRRRAADHSDGVFELAGQRNVRDRPRVGADRYLDAALIDALQRMVLHPPYLLRLLVACRFY